MADNRWQQQFKKQGYTRLRWAMTTFMDAGFLVLWIIAQRLVTYVARWLALDGIDQQIFLVFQIAFAVSTLSPILTFLYKDISILWIRAQREIKREMELHTE